MAGATSDALGNASGAVSSLFAGFAAEKKADMFRIQSQADKLKGKGDLLEADSYTRARELALTNKDFATESTAIQEAQAARAITMSTGGVRAAYGASGLAQEGSAVDVLAASAQQGELEKQLLQKQGVISEAGYQEQADTYANMTDAAKLAAQTEDLASQGHLKAAEAEDQAATGDFIQTAIKGVAAVASIAAAPMTGGLSLAALPALAASAGSAAP